MNHTEGTKDKENSKMQESRVQNARWCYHLHPSYA